MKVTGHTSTTLSMSDSNEFLKQLDAFIDGIEEHTKEAGFTDEQEKKLWQRIGDNVEAAVILKQSGKLEKDAGDYDWSQFFPKFLNTLTSPEGIGGSLRSAIPGVLGGALVSLLSKNQRKHWLRNSLLGGGLGYLAYPTFSAFSGVGETGRPEQTVATEPTETEA